MSHGGLGGPIKVDINRVEAINQNILSVLNSKTPMEAAQAILKTFRQAFKAVQRVSLFIVNRYLQAYVFTNIGEYKRFYKAIAIS